MQFFNLLIYSNYHIYLWYNLFRHCDNKTFLLPPRQYLYWFHLYLYFYIRCIRPAVPEGKTYLGAELLLTLPATPEPILIDKGHAERIQVQFPDGYI